MGARLAAGWGMGPFGVCGAGRRAVVTVRLVVMWA